MTRFYICKEGNTRNQAPRILITGLRCAGIKPSQFIIEQGCLYLQTCDTKLAIIKKTNVHCLVYRNIEGVNIEIAKLGFLQSSSPKLVPVLSTLLSLPDDLFEQRVSHESNSDLFPVAPDDLKKLSKRGISSDYLIKDLHNPLYWFKITNPEYKVSKKKLNDDHSLFIKYLLSHNGREILTTFAEFSINEKQLRVDSPTNSDVLTLLEYREQSKMIAQVSTVATFQEACELRY